MKKKIKISFIFLLLMVTGCRQQNNDVRKAVEDQLKKYPESTLQDIYKSFFQDEFGPGHLIENVSVAREYFDLELEDLVSRGRHDAEPCGTGKNFYRVPMDLVKDGMIKDEDFFKAFMESSRDFKVPDISAWKKRWEEIEKDIEGLNKQIPNFEQDKEALLKMIDMGEIVVHHSNSYSNTYDPHYRIMGKAQWERLRESIR